MDFRSFVNKDDKILLIYCVMLLKNANNLILELGPYSFGQFVLDNQKQLLAHMQQSTDKSMKAQQVVQAFLSSQRTSPLFAKPKKSISDEEEQLFEVLNVSEKVK